MHRYVLLSNMNYYNYNIDMVVYITLLYELMNHFKKSIKDQPSI